MRVLRSKLSLVVIAVAGAVGLVALRHAWATAPQGFSAAGIVGPSLLAEFSTKSNVDGHKVQMRTKGDSDVYVTEIRITPGGHGGWHSHPGPSIIAVKSGEATFYDDCDGAETPHVYAAGNAFVEDAVCVHLLKNEGDVDLVVVVIQIVPRGAPRRIDEQQPQ